MRERGAKLQSGCCKYEVGGHGMNDRCVDAEEGQSKVRGHLDQSRWKRRSENLTRICEATAWSVEPELVYQRIADVVAEVLRCNQTHLHLPSVGGDRFIKLAYHANGYHESEWEDVLPSTVGRMQWMMRTHEPIVMDYEHPHSEDQIPAEASRYGFKSAVSIPLVAEGELVGMCSVVYGVAVQWDEDGLEYLSKIGRILGVAIRRMQVTKKTSELQVLAERKRLSSEIHDNISQLIGSLSLNASTAIESYDAGDDEAVRADLERLETTGGKVMRILRDEMLSLRIPLERTDGFVTGIRDCIANFEKNWDMPVELCVKTSSDPLTMPLQTSMQLTRILNEGLSNTLRHAEATSITVVISESARCLTMTIEDDGKGFDPQTVPPDRLGLRIMHERAEAAGGVLTVLSGDQGTTVCIDVPKSRMSSVEGSIE